MRFGIDDDDDDAGLCLCFDRIHPPEHFKEKYAVDEVHYTCDVSESVFYQTFLFLWFNLKVVTGLISVTSWCRKWARRPRLRSDGFGSPRLCEVLVYKRNRDHI